MRKLFFLLSICISLQAFGQENAEQFTEEAKLFYEKNDYSSALIMLGRALEKDKNFAKAYYVRGIIKKRLGDFTGAMSDFESAIKIKSDYLEAYVARGDTRYATQNFEGAIEDYTYILELDDDMLDIYYKRGQAKLMLSSYSEAIQDCDKILEQNPKNVDAYFLRGVIKVEYGLLDSGCRDLSVAGEMGDLRAYDEIRKRCGAIKYNKD
ncbi:MAG: tetratricopeptide repeat protein [Cyclobacteriaceae bacterium]